MLLPYFLARSTGAVTVGYFAIARNVLLYLGLLHTAVMVPLLPEWAHLYEQKDGRALLKSYRDARNALFCMAFIYGAVFLIGREHLIGFIFGSAMKPATPAILTMLAAGPACSRPCSRCARSRRC